MKFTLALVVLFGGFLNMGVAANAAFTLEKTPTGGAIVKYKGQPFAEYVVDQANKPYLAPIFGPTGKQMTRNYPMKKVDGEKQDHPHHRGLNFGHEDVGGSEFWAEQTTYNEMNARKAGSGNARAAKLGHTKHREYREFKASGDQAVIVDIVDWVGHDGKKYWRKSVA